MFKKILIANRGEIAIRIIRACNELGISTVAIHSEVDKDCLHVRYADENICVGPADNSLSYRNVPNIISAAEITDAEAIHPGYGFLAENSSFAEVCKSAGITFIGPEHETISLMGNKSHAREVMKQNNIPIIPGSDGVLDNPEQAKVLAEKIGYPVIVKASSGGGGRGMRIVHAPEELSNAFNNAQMEAESAFGDKSLYMEKYFIAPRHIEFQILGDAHGNIVQLGERECSIQRRQQKLIEETPSPFLDEETRAYMAETALRVAKAVNYQNAGTVEFLMDKNKNFYFIEMNTRVQVEHPITEMATGIDIIQEQIKIALGKRLSFKQKDITFRGHTFECRINAEDPETFAPSPGRITAFYPPGGFGVRVDSLAYPNYVVLPYYDSLIAKIIVHATTRQEAMNRMKRVLNEFILDGIKTTIPLHKKIFANKNFKKGDYTTHFLDDFISNKK